MNAGGSISVVVGTDPTAVQGALWMGFTGDGQAVLKFRNGDYEYNFLPDSSNLKASALPALDTGVKGQIYYLGTTASTVNGGLWYELEGGQPKLALHYGKNVIMGVLLEFLLIQFSMLYRDSADCWYTGLRLA